MDTPEKNKIPTSASKFEDSPVFNYINSLSPIKPVKSQHISQTFNSLSFASLPSVFNSPHVVSHKESRFVKSVSDSSKPEILSENPSEQRESNSASVEASVNVAIEEIPRALNYDSGSPERLSTDPENLAAEPPEARDSGRAAGDVEVEETRYDELCLSEQRKDEGSVCDWESLISDSADILIFNSPNGTEGFKGLSLCTQMQNVNPVISCGEQHSQEEIFSQIEDFDQQNADPNTSERKDKQPASYVAFSCKSVLSLHRGIRRRCLDFEMAGARRNISDDGSNGSSSLSQPDQRIGPPLRLCDSSRRALPGIGLHLNALAATSKEGQIVKSDSLSPGIQIRMPNSNVRSLLCPNVSLEALDRSLASSVSVEIDSDSAENGSQVPESLAIDEFNQSSSPKKKRRRIENGGETEGCKRCNCKKSKCLKLYCECFAAGVYCIEPCSCQECFNKPIHEDTVLATRKQIESRNPLAFAPKVIRSAEPVPEYGQHEESSKTPASARHKRGCNCKKSSCLKKYCECYQGGVGCSINCRCEGCKNAFGRKDGSSSALIDADVEPDEEEADVIEKSAINQLSSHKIEIHNINNNNIEDRNLGSATLPITPLRITRPLVPLSFSSKGKPPRSSFLGTSSSLSGSYGHKLTKPSIFRSSQQPKFEKPTQSIPENNEELPEILREESSPIAGIKAVSPNSKRISPPQCHGSFGSPGRRSGRKLILQSIPSFPSLTPNQF